MSPPTPFRTSEAVTRLATSWHNRAQYGNILKRIIKTQDENYKAERDKINKTKISQNIAYLIQTLSSIIKDEKQIEERIKKLEENAGLTKKK